MKIYIGTSGYGHDEWKGKFYPEKISPKKMLGFYAERLNSVEINNTFYHMPSESVLKSWAEQVSDDFVFAIKAPQIITHIKRLRNVIEESEHLFDVLPALGRKLGPILFQFPKSFHVDIPALEDFLELVPGNFSCAFEFRHNSWISKEILSLLHKEDHSLCLADTDENPVDEITSTAKWGYLRLRRSDYTKGDLLKWLELILAQKWNKAFVFFKHETGPLIAEGFRALADSKMKHVQGKKK